jgi:hypothetical protein
MLHDRYLTSCGTLAASRTTSPPHCGKASCKALGRHSFTCHWHSCFQSTCTCCIKRGIHCTRWADIAASVVLPPTVTVLSLMNVAAYTPSLALVLHHSLTHCLILSLLSFLYACLCLCVSLSQSQLFFSPTLSLLYCHNAVVSTCHCVADSRHAQFWVHTTIIRRLGPLEYVLMTPR